jgi:hypothetical protein
MQHTPILTPHGESWTGTFPPAITLLARHERSDPLMDPETTPVAPATERSTVGTAPADQEGTTPPRRRSDWGKVQVKPRTEAPTKPATEAPARTEPRPRVAAPAKPETAPKRETSRPATTERREGSERNGETPVTADAASAETGEATTPASRSP